MSGLENDPFYLRYVASNLYCDAMLMDLQILVSFLTRSCHVERTKPTLNPSFQHRTLWQAWPRVPRVRVLARASALCQQLELPQRQSHPQRKCVTPSLSGITQAVTNGVQPNQFFLYHSVDRPSCCEGAQTHRGGERDHQVRFYSCL
jgi:hypothetical protein